MFLALFNSFLTVVLLLASSLLRQGTFLVTNLITNGQLSLNAGIMASFRFVAELRRIFEYHPRGANDTFLASEVA